MHSTRGAEPSYWDYDMWDLSERALAVDRPYPRPGETLGFRITMPGQANRVWLLGLALGDRPGIPLRYVPGWRYELLPLRPDLLLFASWSVPLGGVLDPLGQGFVSLPVPPDPWLIGFDVHAAAFTLHGGASVGGISNGVPMTVVR